MNFSVLAANRRTMLLELEIRSTLRCRRMQFPSTKRKANAGLLVGLLLQVDPYFAVFMGWLYAAHLTARHPASR